MKKIFILTLSFFLVSSLFCRGCLHFVDPTIPSILTEWQWNFPEERIYFPTLSTEKCLYTNATITEFPIFKTFDRQDLKKNYLPKGKIFYRNSTKEGIESKDLEKILQNFFEEILQKKDMYTDFTILKNDDFNLKKQAGLLIVKCKKHPFVVKLFMETPRSFMRPYNKGIIPLLQFGVGGGATRHLTGFTRIKNSKTVVDFLNKTPEWKNFIDVPRKWYWLPEYPWIHIQTQNLGELNEIKSITLPGAYMIIADYIAPEKKFKIIHSQDRKKILDLSNYLECRIDPHINNFLIEKNTGKLVIIDTEHFPTLTGLRKPIYLSSYHEYYLSLANKFLKERIFSLKKDRIERQKSGYRPFCTA